MDEYGMWCSSRWCGRRSHLRSDLWCSSQLAQSLQDSPVSGLRHPQTKASDVEWSCWFRFLRVSRMTFWFESCQNFALVHCHLESWTIQTIEFRSVMAMRFMTLGLLPRVPESTLVGACVDYSVCRQWSNQKHLDHRFGGIAHSNCLGGSYPPQHVMLVQHGFAACDVDLFYFYVTWPRVQEWSHGHSCFSAQPAATQDSGRAARLASKVET